MSSLFQLYSLINAMWTAACALPAALNLVLCPFQMCSLTNATWTMLKNSALSPLLEYTANLSAVVLLGELMVMEQVAIRAQNLKPVCSILSLSCFSCGCTEQLYP